MIRNADPIDFGRTTTLLSKEELEATWNALAEHKTLQRAADALGLSRSAVGRRLRVYCRENGLPKGSRPPVAGGDPKALDKRLCLEAWEAWGRYGTVREAAKMLGLTYHQCRSRIERHRAYRELGVYSEPDTLLDFRHRQYRAAWLAWEAEGTQAKGATAIGIALSTFEERIALHKHVVGMPRDANPHTHTVDGTVKERP
jgi:DNA-binding Lrp family transcriptional regulator